jgi:hypothetical protein
MAASLKHGRSKSPSKSPTKKSTSPRKSRSFIWSDENVSELLSIMKEETILYNLNNAKTPKEKRSAYRHVAAKLEEKGMRNTNGLATLTISNIPWGSECCIIAIYFPNKHFEYSHIAYENFFESHISIV